MDMALSGTITPGQSWTRSNGNEEVLDITQSSRAGASSSDGLLSYIGHLPEKGYQYLQRCCRWILQH